MMLCFFPPELVFYTTFLTNCAGGQGPRTALCLICVHCGKHGPAPCEVLFAFLTFFLLAAKYCRVNKTDKIFS